MYLINLEGQGDTDIKIVNQEIWDKVKDDNDAMLELEDDECIVTFYNDMKGRQKSGKSFFKY